MTQLVGLDGATPPFMAVAQHLGFVYHLSLFTSSWIRGGAAGAMYAVTTSGWMEQEAYETCCEALDKEWTSGTIIRRSLLPYWYPLDWNKPWKKHTLPSNINVSKEDFLNLVAQLWSASFKPQHLQGGFRESGLAISLTLWSYSNMPQHYHCKLIIPNQLVLERTNLAR